jgi:hypothetical protein
MVTEYLVTVNVWHLFWVWAGTVCFCFGVGYMLGDKE